MAKRTARRAVVEDEGTNDPSRPDNIPSQSGDDEGSVVDATGKPDVIDVNDGVRDEDARPDAVKEAERLEREEEESRQERATDELPDRDDDDDKEDGAKRRARRRGNRARELERGSSEEVTNLTAENKRMAARLAKLERGGNQQQVETTISGMRAQIESLKKDLIAHTEGGKTAEAMEAQIKISEIQAKLALAERDLEILKRTPEPEAAADDGAKKETKRPKIVDDWLVSNRRWWNMPSAAPLRAAATAIDNDILADIKDNELDFEPYSEDHVDEMTKRLLAEAKRLGLDFEIKDFNGEVFEPDEEEQEEERPAATGRERGKDVKTTTTRRPAAGGLGGREGGRKPPSDLELARQGKARLTEADYAQMRVYKLDPNDKAARTRFAKERVRTILTEARKGERK